jgi:NADH-quinone oxidoreductase subunit G
VRQRLDRPYVRKGGKLQPATWGEAFDAVAAAIAQAGPARTGVIAGDLQDAESMKAALDLFKGLGVTSLDCRQDGAVIGGGAREAYLFNTTIAGLEQCDALLLVGTNPRLEAPLINARIRKRWVAAPLQVGLVGEQVDLTYAYDYLGAGSSTLADVISGKHSFSETLKNAKNPAIIVGAGALAGEAGDALLAQVAEAAKTFGIVREGWNGFNVLHTAAARVGGLDMDFLPGEGGLTAPAMVAKGALDVLVLLGADEIDLSQTDAFVIYLGAHGDAGAHRADVILPGAAYTEKAGIYVNTEGRVQLANRAVFPKGEAREDWAILRALSDRLGHTLPYDTLAALRQALFAEHPTFGQVDYAPGAATAAGFDLGAVGVKGAAGGDALASRIGDFYLTNPIARASVTMAECSALAASSRAKPVAAE